MSTDSLETLPNNPDFSQFCLITSDWYWSALIVFILTLPFTTRS